MFRFSLQPVLEHRKAIEEKRQGELSQVVQIIRRREDEIATLVAKRKIECESALREPSGPIGSAYRSLLGDWIEWANEDIDRIEKEITVLNFEADRRRTLLAEAAKASMTLEKLQEKEEAEYREEEKKEEQKLFDELALREFAINRQAAKVSGRRKGMHDEG